MATPSGGTASYITNKGAGEAVPVDLVAGTVEVSLGANVGIQNVAEDQINPSTEEKQDDGITLLATIDTAQDLTNTKLTAIDLDTSKIPPLGTASMPASSPVTIATDDAQFATIEATLTNIEKCLMGNAAPNVDAPGMISVAVVLAASTADQVIAASAANKQIWVYGLH